MSKRLGCSKAFLSFHGEPLLSHIISQVSLFSDEIVIAIGIRDSILDYQQFLSGPVRIVKDDLLQQSPLVGIFTGLRSTKSANAMVLPCDLPFISESIVSFLFDKIIGRDAAIPRWSNGDIEPLHSTYNVAKARLAAEEALSAGQLRVSNMIDRLNDVVYVNVEELRRFDRMLLTFFNINTQDDLKKAEQLLLRSRSP